MISELNVNNNSNKNQIVPLWFFAVFIIMITALMIILFPIDKIPALALKITTPQPITQYYLEQLVQYHPTKTDIRIALIKQQIGLYNWNDAQAEINILKKNADMQTETRLLEFLLAYTKVYQMPKGIERNNTFNVLRTEVATFANVKLSITQLIMLADISLNLGLPKLALDFYQKVGPINDVVLLRHIAVTALQSSQYAISAKYYMLAEEREKTLEDKRIDVISALGALQQGSVFSMGIDIIIHLPDDLVNNKAMLLYLAKFTLAANRPDLAQSYIKRALLK